MGCGAKKDVVDYGGKCCKAEEFEKGIVYVTHEMNVFNTFENDSPWVR